MNNRHVLRLFTIYMHLLTHIRNGLTHKTSTTARCVYISHISHAAKLQRAFGIDSNNDDNRVHPEHFCLSCKRALDRVIRAMHKNIHYKRGTAPFQWDMHSDRECKVGDYTCAHMKYEVLLCIQICEHFHESARGALAKGAKKKRTMSVLKGGLPGINPNMSIGCVNKTAPHLT